LAANFAVASFGPISGFAFNNCRISSDLLTPLVFFAIGPFPLEESEECLDAFIVFLELSAMTGLEVLSVAFSQNLCRLS
jgi:hypothetical protein